MPSVPLFLTAAFMRKWAKRGSLSMGDVSENDWSQFKTERLKARVVWCAAINKDL